MVFACHVLQIVLLVHQLPPAYYARTVINFRTLHVFLSALMVNMPMRVNALIVQLNVIPVVILTPVYHAMSLWFLIEKPVLKNAQKENM